MKKSIFINLCIGVLLVCVVNAIEDCEKEMLPDDIPCMIISSWSYSECNSSQAFIYNSTPTLITTRNFTNYGSTNGRCNFTWNYSSTGSYIWNVSNGDTGRIIVRYERDPMASLGIIIFVMALTAILFILPYKVDFSRQPLADYILKKACIIFGMFLLSLDVTIVITIADTFGLGVNQELFRYLWIVNWSIYLMIIYTMWNTLQGSLRLMKEMSQRKRMGLYEE